MNQCIICQRPAANKLCKNPACRSEFCRRSILDTIKRHGGQLSHLRKTNGMHDPSVREKVSAKLKEMHWSPVKRGGNGHGPTPQEMALARELGWQTNVVVNTRMPRGSGYPSCYKLDVGEPLLKIGIEVDGNSHNAISRRLQDAKKDAFLAGLGWKVLRFKNSQIDHDVAGVARTIISQYAHT